MNKYSNFREFYEKELRSDLEIIDQERKKVNRCVLIIFLITIVIITGELIWIPSSFFMLKAAVPMITVIAGIIMIGIFSKSFRREYKNKIIARIAGFTDKELVYSPDGAVPYNEFVKSGIFPFSCDRYTGEDYFRGKFGKTEIEFSEITAKHKSTSGSGQKDEYTIFFRGLFIIADFNKHFKTHTVVLPDTAEKLFGKFGQTLQSIFPDRGELIRLEDPSFEKEFCVYGDDQVEARYILSPALMERIVTFKRKWNKRIYFSFIDSKVYIAISMNKNLFELRSFKPAADYPFLEENLRFLILLTEVVDDLNLNTRIWTKE